MSPIIIFRTDASSKIGSGHVKRCIALAEAIRIRGGLCHFILRDYEKNLKEYICEKGFCLHIISATNTISLDENITAQQDADACLEIIGRLILDGEEVSWVIVDQYELDINWEKKIRQKVKKIFVIDDLGNRAHDCEFLLDQNFGSNRKKYELLANANIKFLLGTKYALLQESFFEARKKTGVRDGTILRILVSFGGSDGTDETSKVLIAFQLLALKKIKINVVIGPQFTTRDKIVNLASTLENIEIHENITDLSDLTASCDLVIGAAGISLLERCCVGAPSIVVGIADNQIAGAMALAAQGGCIYLGPAYLSTNNLYVSTLKFLLLNPLLLISLSSHSWNIVDGKGAERVAKIIVPAEILLRPATKDDCRIIFEWRNSPNIRKNSFDTQLINWDKHIHWYKESLANTSRIILIGSHNGQDLGVLRYDLKDKRANVSIFLISETGKGYGTQMLKLGSAWLRENYPHIQGVDAQIKYNNDISLVAFESAGFVKSHLVVHQELLQ